MSMWEQPVSKRPLPSLASIDATKSVHHPMENNSHSQPIPIPSFGTSGNVPLPSLSNHQHHSFSASTEAVPLALPKLRSMSLGEYMPQGRQHHTEPEVARFNNPQEFHVKNEIPIPHSWTPNHSHFLNQRQPLISHPQSEFSLSRSWTTNSAAPHLMPRYSSSSSTAASSWSPSPTALQQMSLNNNSSSSDDDEQPDEESDPLNRGSTRVCRTKSCKNVARSKGLCRSHGGGKRCTEPGCSKSAQANKKCIAHGGGTPCSFENCDKTSQSRGLCKAHGGGARCKYPSCPKSSQSRGFCRGHGGGVRCKADGCEKWVQKNGFCIKHGREQP
ncbi:hypothetical protein H310_14419 [Aphanomyces invadans]|uniref:WRKY19-like zinc finger domain-containing protein n=1 Tax=Aphanomyces invadans TaxID=157072 RepID=A0A024TC08_9STRA|nr:hypothetical protein H310_14419 [Aphanomyces invadans]ETV90862.1 hypothetical protein H310_14419 [Aphanomyces invadans]|eukprot:XP_008880498.1 hypothetical protein H310_14419 [Aphanomyces invadans]